MASNWLFFCTCVGVAKTKTVTSCAGFVVGHHFCRRPAFFVVGQHFCRHSKMAMIGLAMVGLAMAGHGQQAFCSMKVPAFASAKPMLMYASAKPKLKCIGKADAHVCLGKAEAQMLRQSGSSASPKPLASHGGPWPADPLPFETCWSKPRGQPWLAMGFGPLV